MKKLSPEKTQRAAVITEEWISGHVSTKRMIDQMLSLSDHSRIVLIVGIVMNFMMSFALANYFVLGREIGFLYMGLAAGLFVPLMCLFGFGFLYIGACSSLSDVTAAYKNNNRKLHATIDSYHNTVSGLIESQQKQSTVKIRGYVYLVEAQSGVIKIGNARDPKKRLTSLQTGAAEKLTFRHIIPSVHPKDLERHLHLKYSHKRINGEWFRLSDKEIKDIADWGDI